MLKNFYKKNRVFNITPQELSDINTDKQLVGQLYDEVIQKNVFENHDKDEVHLNTPKFSYFLVKKDDKWAVAKQQMEFLTGFDFDRIDVYREGNNFNVLSLQNQQQNKFFLIEENCDYKELIIADCKFIDLIPSSEYNEELYKFSVYTISEYYNNFWMNNMGMDEDEACAAASALRPIKNMLIEMADKKFEEYKEIINMQQNY